MSVNGPSVLLVGGDQWGEAKMFTQRGWNIVRHPDVADFLCFTGGSDIDPAFYGQKRLPCTFPSPRRDVYEKAFWDAFPDKPKIGICRGGQLLNALSGGDMFQDVDGHQGTHDAIDVATGVVFQFSSVHHQMMIPGDGAVVLAVANEATRREKENKVETIVDAATPLWMDDPEAIWYEKTQSFCFQPHPEWGPTECTDYFFRKIDNLFGLKRK